MNKRDREYLERVIDERDQLYKDHFRAMENLIDERDRLYDSRFKAQELAITTALAAQEKSVNAAFAASEKAINKSDQAQHDYNERSNEFRGQLDDQAKTLMPRTESLSMHAATGEKIVTMQASFDSKLDNFKTAMEKQTDALDAQISVLREYRSERGGSDSALKESATRSQWSTGLIVAVILAVVSMLMSVYMGTRAATVPVVYNTPSQPTPALVPAPANK